MAICARRSLKLPHCGAAAGRRWCDGTFQEIAAPGSAAFSAQYQQRPSWLDAFRTELLAFPNGAHDDQADALSQLINWTCNRSTYTLDNL